MAFKGFTLLELIITVAIAGILAAISVPNFMNFAAKARQAEARHALGAMYTAEAVFHQLEESYSQCLRQLGYDPTGNGIRYYSTGYMGGSVPECGPNGTTDCDGYSYNPTIRCVSSCGGMADETSGTTFVQTVKVNPDTVLINDCGGQAAAGLPDYWNVKKDEFIVGAGGNISWFGEYDLWSIDNFKNVVNERSGL